MRNKSPTDWKQLVLCCHWIHRSRCYMIVMENKKKQKKNTSETKILLKCSYWSLNELHGGRYTLFFFSFNFVCSVGKLVLFNCNIDCPKFDRNFAMAGERAKKKYVYSEVINSILKMAVEIATNLKVFFSLLFYSCCCCSSVSVQEAMEKKSKSLSPPVHHLEQWEGYNGVKTCRSQRNESIIFVLFPLTLFFHLFFLSFWWVELMHFLKTHCTSRRIIENF